MDEFSVSDSFAHLIAARVEFGSPSQYRLRRDRFGGLVLQGAFRWQQGCEGGHEWRDIETVDSQEQAA